VEHKIVGRAVLRYQITPPTAHAREEEAGPAATTGPALPATLFKEPPAAPVLPRPLSPSGAGALIEPGPDEVPATRSPVLEEGTEPSFAIERGIAAHRLLQVLPTLASSEREAAARRYLDRIGAGWPPAERERLWRSVETILEDASYAPLFAEGSRAEVSVMGRIVLGAQERAVSGKIDRLVAGADEVLIVDYKTNRP